MDILSTKVNEALRDNVQNKQAAAGKGWGKTIVPRHGLYNS